jgi:transglutaminase-like putative cysteine protease
MRFQATHKLTTYLVVLAAFAALACSDALPATSGIVFLVAWALSWGVDPGGRVAALLDRASIPLRAGLVAVFAVAGLEVWRRLPEPDLGPVLTLVLTLLAYKLFHRRGNRDYLHIYVLAFLLVLAASALAATFLFAAAFAVYVVLATWTLILFHLRREMEENYLVKHSAQAPSQKVGVARILNSRRVVGGSFFAATGVVAIGVFAGAVATFALIPRVGAGFVFGAARPTENLIGFSDDVALGHYGVLSGDNQVVALRATIPRIAALDTEAARDRALERLYWRGTVYDRYDHGHWTRSQEPALRTMLEHAGPVTLIREPAFEAQAPEPEAGERLRGAERQEIDVVGLPVPVVFALEQPLAVELPSSATGGGGLRLAARWSGEVALRFVPFPYAEGGAAAPEGGGADAARDAPEPAFGGVGRFSGLSGFSILGTRYVAYSAAGRGAARATGDLPSAIRAAYLVLPASLSPRVSALARQLTAGLSGASARMHALSAWLRTNHEYTVHLPRRPAGVDPVEDFLFDQRVGHCEYFASAMVVLLRAAGIPARYVNGYLGAEWNQIGKYLTVRDNRAHSWAEAYLGDEGGWVRVDATPPVLGQTRTGRLRQLVESVDFYWTRWVVGYDLDRQLDLARRVGRRLGLGAGRGAMHPNQPPGWALVLLAVAVLAAVASRRWTRAVPEASPPRERGRGRDTPVNRLYRRAVGRLARAGFPRRAAETPREYAARVSDAGLAGSDALERLTELYTASRFGGRSVEAEVLRDVARRLSRLGARD